MAMTRTYLTMNGKIRSEHRSGEAHSRDFVHDASGNVVGVYQNGWMLADAVYDPSGGLYSQWNMDAHGYRFTWMGAWGYRRGSVPWSNVYVRARHYSKHDGAWTSVDPLWPDEMAYGYVEGRVMTGVDYWGMQRKGEPSQSRGSKPKPKGFRQTNGECGVFICDQFGWSNGIVTHRYICVKDANNGCAGGLMGRPTRIEDENNSCESNDDSGFPIKCKKISTNCNLSTAVCDCLYYYKQEVPLYGWGHFCWHFPDTVLGCACDVLALRGIHPGPGDCGVLPVIGNRVAGVPGT